MQRDVSIRHRQGRKRADAVFGLLLTVAVNASIVLLCSFNGLKYIYPPPEEKILIEFEEAEPPRPPVKTYGREPSAEEVVPDAPLNLVRKSEAPLEGQKQNVSKESVVDAVGDVEVPAPKQEEQIDSRSLFHSAHNTDKDTLAPQTARDPSDVLKAGHASGNSIFGEIEGTPMARVKGRKTVGVPQRPSYTVQNEGTVVVEIYVNPLGSVERAIPGFEGTTVTDKELWNSARKAAMATKFDVVPDAPGLVQGTITYIFKLK